MSFQSIGLLIIFLVGAIASCVQLFPVQPPSGLASATRDKIASTKSKSQNVDEAATVLDNGQGEKASKMFHEILQTDLSKTDSEKTRIVVDLNNEAVALYLSARSQPDAKRAAELLTLSRECLATAQSTAHKLNLSSTEMAVSYNQYTLIDLLGEHGKANRILAIASQRRRNLKPTLLNGLIP